MKSRNKLLLLTFLFSIIGQSNVFTASKHEVSYSKSGSSTTTTQIMNLDAFEHLKETSTSESTSFQFEYFHVKNPREVQTKLKEKGFFTKDKKQENKNILCFFDFDGVLFTPGGLTKHDVDQGFVKIIKKLKKAGIRVAGLTKRPYIPKYADPCFEAFDLFFEGFDLLPEFSGKLTYGESIFYPNVGWIGGSFMHGVFHVCNHNNKSDAMKKCLETLHESEGLNLSQVTVIFIDDYRDFLEDVEKACREAGVSHYLAFWHTDQAVLNPWKSFASVKSKSDKKSEKVPEKAKESSSQGFSFSEMLRRIFS